MTIESRQGTQPQTLPAEHVFLNYRRNDAASQAGHIYSELVERFGADSVFIDIEALQPGVDFVDGLQQEIGRCAVLLVVIGHDWLSVTGPTGQRRIDEPNDFVRLEIEAALQRAIRVIPVLVDGAVMPEPGELPESIASLGRRQAIEVRNEPSYFAFDVGRLIQALEAILPSNEPPAASRPAAGAAPRARGGNETDMPTSDPPPSTGGSSRSPREPGRDRPGRGRGLWRLLLPAGVVIVALVVVLAAGSAHKHHPQNAKASTGHVPTTPAPATTPTSVKPCDPNISADSATTSCQFAENLFVAYFDDYKVNGQQASNVVTASSPVTHVSYAMHCRNTGTVVTCTGGKGAYVTFPFWAVQVYGRG